MSDLPKIEGFDLRGNLYRAMVAVEHGVAVDVATEAAERALPVATVMRDRVTRAKRKRTKRAAVTTDRHTSETERSRGGK